MLVVIPGGIPFHRAAQFSEGGLYAFEGSLRGSQIYRVRANNNEITTISSALFIEKRMGANRWLIVDLPGDSILEVAANLASNRMTVRDIIQRELKGE